MSKKSDRVSYLESGGSERKSSSRRRGTFGGSRLSLSSLFFGASAKEKDK